jgi:hypothetical protein
MTYKFARGTKPIGEYPEEAIPALLQSNVLLPSDFFWGTGMPQWEAIHTKWNSSAPPLPSASTVRPAAARSYSVPSCQQCSSPMKKTEKVDKSIALQVAGILVFLIGLALLFAFPIGTVFGVLLMIGAARMGSKKVKIWKCTRCSYFFERAD